MGGGGMEGGVEQQWGRGWWEAAGTEVWKVQGQRPGMRHSSRWGNSSEFGRCMRAASGAKIEGTVGSAVQNKRQRGHHQVHPGTVQREAECGRCEVQWRLQESWQYFNLGLAGVRGSRALRVECPTLAGSRAAAPQPAGVCNRLDPARVWSKP